MSPISKIALGALASMLLGSTAMAADLMAPPPVEAAMTSDWTGGYIGLQGSAIRDSSAVTSAFPANECIRRESSASPQHPGGGTPIAI